jgi:hypothetical protein
MVELKLSGGTLTPQAALAAHETAWKKLLNEHQLQELSKQIAPTTLSWKVTDKAALFASLEDNAAAIEQFHTATVNDRYIASAVLKEPCAGLAIFKVLERRSGSDDPLGLDSVDYLTDDMAGVFKLCRTAGLNIVEESNDMHAWLSLRFGERDQFEAKITDHLVLDIGVKELQVASKRILRQLSTNPKT